MASVGRPRILDDPKKREIIALISAGYGIYDAADYVDCSPDTIRRELARDEAFADRFRKATLGAELDPLTSIRQSAKSNWRAAAWYLERVHPQKYAKRNPVLVKHEEIEDIVESMTNLIFDEVKCKETQLRIISKLLKLAAVVDRSAAEHVLAAKAGPLQVDRTKIKKALEGDDIDELDLGKIREILTELGFGDDLPEEI
jgi:hypothetical protein